MAVDKESVITGAHAPPYWANSIGLVHRGVSDGVAAETRDGARTAAVILAESVLKLQSTYGSPVGGGASVVWKS